MTLMISRTALRVTREATPTVVAVDILSYAIGECALG